MLQRVKKIVDQINGRVKSFVPEVGIVLGSGLDGMYKSVSVLDVIPYGELDGMPVSTAPGHKGEFIFGYIADKPVVMMRGRIHYYEGYSTAEVTLPIRVMALLGIKYLFISNAAGGVREEFSVGDLMLITDHINFIPNPLLGPNIDDFGVRFPVMANAYDAELLEKARKIAKMQGIRLWEGIYVALTGPSFETPAEYEFVNKIGGSVVGMSTTPEVIVARHMGVKVLAVSLISNVACEAEKLSEDDVIKQGKIASEKMSQLFVKIIEIL